MHHLVRLTLDGEDSDAHLDSLIKSWRFARTSELADVIEALTRRKSSNAPAPPMDEAAADAWCTACVAASSFELGWLLESLADQAANSWDSPDREACWRRYTRCLGALRDRDPDPRIGRAIEDALEGPGDYWFRPDQVEHVVTTFPQQDDAPSFADHALRLLKLHGDAGSARRLQRFAKLLLKECDCNGADMSEMLTELAGSLERRWPNDDAVDDGVLDALDASAITAGS